MIFEFEATVKREVEEKVEIVVDAVDEVEAEQKALSLIEDQGKGFDVHARRFLVTNRRYETPEVISLTAVLYEEDNDRA